MLKPLFLKLPFIFIVSIILSSCSNKSIVENGVRSKLNINNDWLYLENNIENINRSSDQYHWESINLPHTWNALDATDLETGYRRTGSLYKKDLDIPVIVSGQIYQLYFEGVNIKSKVYVNGKQVGGHTGGYIGFAVDITEAISAGKNNVLVRVDNGYDPEVIPSQKSNFFIFGGITRDVWLQTLPKQHIANV